MIKDFNSFITEDKEYNEIFTLVEEVLSNDYSNQEIEESFDEFNLLLESLSDENVKKYLKLYNEFNGNKSKIKDVESQKKDLKKEFNNEIKKLHQSDLPISKIVDKQEKLIYDYQKKLRSLVVDKFDDDSSKEKTIDYGNSELCKGFVVFQIYEFKNFMDEILKQFNRLKKDENEEFHQRFNTKTGENIIETLSNYLSSISELFDKVDGNIKNFTSEVISYFKCSKVINVSDKLELNKDGLKIYMEKNGILDDESNDSQEKIEPTPEDVSDVISDNKDLLTPLAKEANVTADQLSNIVSKLCLTKTGKSRKLDSGVVTGLSIIICGVLLTVKKNGKNDRKAVVDVINKISELIEQKKGFKKILQ